MIQLVKNTTNQIYLNVANLREVEGFDYFFTFVHEQEKKEYEITLTDVSSYNYRYSKFALILPTDLDLKKEGDYCYRVYEDDTRANLLAIGMAHVDGTPRDNNTYEATTGNNKIYDDKQ